MAPVAAPYDEATTAVEGSGAADHGVSHVRPAAGRAPGRSTVGAATALSRRSALSLRNRALFIDRTTAVCGAEYEWAINAGVYAAKADVTEAQVPLVRTRRRRPRLAGRPQLSVIENLRHTVTSPRATATARSHPSPDEIGERNRGDPSRNSQGRRHLCPPHPRAPLYSTPCWRITPPSHADRLATRDTCQAAGPSNLRSVQDS